MENRRLIPDSIELVKYGEEKKDKTTGGESTGGKNTGGSYHSCF